MSPGMCRCAFATFGSALGGLLFGAASGAGILTFLAPDLAKVSLAAALLLVLAFAQFGAIGAALVTVGTVCFGEDRR